ncbi:MAG TPA: hypothetical protein ENH11_09540 [Candidatus Acetothermia bacterium]|nr:hypothetical protein [Candidatus Acetothermia bacterium]
MTEDIRPMSHVTITKAHVDARNGDIAKTVEDALAHIRDRVYRSVASMVNGSYDHIAPDGIVLQHCMLVPEGTLEHIHMRPQLDRSRVKMKSLAEKETRQDIERDHTPVPPRKDGREIIDGW